jgi:HK97 family phage major capsid protein
MSDFLKKVAEKRAAAKSQQKPARTKGQAVMAGLAKLAGGAPAHVSRLDRGDHGLSIQKAIAYAAGYVTDAEMGDALDLSNRIKAVYGGFYPLGSHPKSLLVPTSAYHLPVENGRHEIPGARELRKEVAQRLAAVKGIDPDEVVALEQKGGNALATKALSTLSDLAGGSTVAPPSLGDLIDLQRNMEVFSRAGATNVTLPANGRMQFPKLTGGSTAYWVGETASVTASDQATGTLNLEVKTLAVRTEMTNQLLRFSDQSVDAMVRLDMARQGALAADLSMLQGTGGTQVKGLITYQSATSWTQGTDKILAYSVTASTFQPEDAAAMHAVLPDHVEPNAWVMRRALWGKIRNRRADGVVPGDGKGPFVFNLTRAAGDGGETDLDGTEVVWSSQVSAARGTGAQTYVLLGYFPDWIVGRLGVMEFAVDPWTQLQNLKTVVQASQFIDAGARHPSSFCLADAVNVA